MNTTTDQTVTTAPAHPDYRTVEEAAQILRVSTRAIHNWVKTGQLSAIKIGRVVRIPYAALLIQEQGGVQ